jgi:hypothetical protein
MPAQVSPSLLAAYLAAAARQVGNGELSERSRWAIAHARHQLQANHDVLAREAAFAESTTGAAVRQVAAKRGPDLAELVLQSEPDTETDVSLEKREAQAARQLESVLDALKAIEEDYTSEAAVQGARRLSEIFADSPQRAAA